MITGRDPHCTLCRLHQTAEYICLLGYGNPHAELMIIGEAPGHREDDSGVPFVGKSGKLLTRLLQDIGFDREDVYITNAVHCRPLSNRTPSKGEIKACRKWLEYEILRVKPKYLLLLGNVPLESVLGQKGIRKMRGKPVEHQGMIVMPTYHPASTFHDPDNLGIIESDFQMMKECIEFGGIPEERELDFVIVDTHELVDEMLSDLSGCVSCDLETTRLYPFTTQFDEEVARGDASKERLREYKAVHNGKKPQIVSIQFGTSTKQWILPAEEPGIFSREELVDIVDRITEKLEDCYIVGQNFKFDSLWMRVRFGVVWEADFDTMLAHYLLDENDFHGLKYLAQKFLGAPDWDVRGDVKTTWSTANAKYGAHDLFYTRKLRYYFGKKLVADPEINKVFTKLMMPCAGVYTELEYNGVTIDQSRMDEVEQYLREELINAERDLSKWAHPDWASLDPTTGKPTINWGSPKQLARLMFDDLGIAPVEKTKTGANSTSESVLLRIDHLMVGALLKWRGATKQLSSFIEGWAPYIDTEGRLHPSFKLGGTVTGRPSCEHPNLQQVPRDKKIRSLITAPDGWVLLEVDFSQIELRIAAELADEHDLLRAFNTGVDVHWLTALREIERGGGYKDEVIETAYRHKQKRMSYSDALEYMLKIGPAACIELMGVWEELRKKAKAVNFGYLFGMWWKKLILYARDNYGIALTEEQAQESRKTFFSLYPRLSSWHEKQRRFARHHGFVRTLTGRKRRLPEAMSQRDTPERREAQRQAINSPVQGFAAELTLMVVIQIRREFGRDRVRLCGTIHDAILMRVRTDSLPTVYRRVLEIMKCPPLLTEFDIELKVPIEAEAKVGAWGLGVKLDKWLDQQQKSKAA